MAKKAMLINIDLLVRIIIDDTVDLDHDPEFEEIVTEVVKNRLREEGVSFIAEGINDYREDEENPYDTEFD
tara:strand:- start:1518 stop:1730 length:213 start_codon:yes stop_codon:yes gene_type:complete